jgi:hypothetical protein
VTLLESLVGVLPVVNAGGFPGGAPVIADLDRGNGSIPAKPLGALEVKGNCPVSAKVPDRKQFLRVEEKFLHGVIKGNPKLPNPKHKRRLACP